MTISISELISKLESLKAIHGDKNLRFTVKDYYSKYGEEMETGLKCGETTGMPTDWADCFTNGDTTTIYFTLNKKEGKRPKITFRKQ